MFSIFKLKEPLYLPAEKKEMDFGLILTDKLKL